MGTGAVGPFFGKNFTQAVLKLCDQNDMGWSINIGTVMVQFIIKITPVNATADVKTDVPSNFEDFDSKHFETFDDLIQTSGTDVWDTLDCSPSYDQVQVDYFNSLS